MNNSPDWQILVLPALGVPARVYTPLLDALAALPHTTAALLPGPAAGGGWRDAVAARRQGYAAWLQALESQVTQRRRDAPGSRVLLLGHSIGGHVALLALARGRVAIDGLVLVASGTPHWRAFPSTEQPRMLRGLRVIGAVLRLWPWYPGERLGFGGTQPRRLMLDWLSLARDGRFGAMAGLADADQQLLRASGRVLAIGIQGDALAPPEARKQLLAAAPGLDVQQALADSERLQRESPPRRHNLWPREPQAVLPHLQRWLHATWPAAAEGGAARTPATTHRP